MERRRNENQASPAPWGRSGPYDSQSARQKVDPGLNSPPCNG
jgi:hypothetical protein